MATIAAIDINNDREAGYLNNVGRKIGHQAVAHGVLLYELIIVPQLDLPSRRNVLICHRSYASHCGRANNPT
jgi:hypothetical protein